MEMYEAATANRLDTVRDLQKKVLQLGAVYSHGLYYSAVIKGIKCALNILGLCSDFMAEPFHKFRAPERDDVRAELEKLGLM
ncbi:MAG: hypothetical protein JXR37_15875 [Kiritimatiellae bacterium]|nr:hypothetical protein [Kiritimatiellia bacterium]